MMALDPQAHAEQPAPVPAARVPVGDSPPGSRFPPSLPSRSHGPSRSQAELSDDELVKQAQSGDSQAQEILLRRYWFQVSHWTHRYFLPGADHDDLFQEGLIGFLKAIHDYLPGSSSFGSFARLCVRRHLISTVKERNRFKHQPLNRYTPLHLSLDGDEEHPLLETLPGGPDPETIALAREQLDAARHVIRHCLSPFEASVLVLYTKGLTYQEMASALSTHAKSIDNALCRIKQKILQAT